LQWSIATFGLLAAGVALIAQGQQPPPGPFRSGTNIVRVDATVVDASGNPVPSLRAADFEVREDGVLQTISSFQFVAADGRSTDDRSLPIRSQEHAAMEAARDDVRTFLILWDDYHIEEHASAYRAREALEHSLLTAFGETDLVGLINQLTPVAAMEFTRDRRAMADRIHQLQGRKGEYFPRNTAEEEQWRATGGDPLKLEALRNMVSLDAITAAATHLRTLGEGRKTLLVFSEGIAPGPRLGQEVAVDLVRTANDSNVVIDIVDPRGMQISSRRNFFLETITEDTGGDLYRTNDLTIPVAKAIRAASAVYLLGYPRESPADGRFHQIKVRVKRRGLDVRARSGYWSLRAEDVERAKAAAVSAVLPPDLERAFSSLAVTGSGHQVDLFAAAKPLEGGRMQITLAWTRRPSEPGNTAARVTVVARANELVFSGDVRPDGTTFETDAIDLQLAFAVLSERGDVLDRETRSVDGAALSAAALAFSTPLVYRAASVAHVRTMQDAVPEAPIYAGRDFGRTDRVFVRTSLTGVLSTTATVTAQLLDRRGTTLAQVPVSRSVTPGTWQVEVPLGSMAAGEYALTLEAANGDSRARTIVPFRLRQ